MFMLINHLVFTGGFWLLEVNHRQFAFVEDAQGFVFLSGLLIGLIYARKMLKHGRAAGFSKVYARAFELYRYAMGMIIVVLLVRIVLPGSREAWWNWLGDTSFSDPKRLIAVATFAFQPTFMDILPQYTVYMLVAPPLIWLCLKGKWERVLVGSLLVWMAAQLGLHRLVTVPLNDALTSTDNQGVRVSFNMMGWQIVFVSALVIGTLWAQDKIDWSRVFSPERTTMVKAALALCLFFLPLRIATAWGLLPDYVIEEFTTMEIRADFGPVYLMNFAAVAYGLSWLIIAGPRHRNAAVRRMANAVVWLLTLRFLQCLGRHSLHVYVWHVAIVYAVYYLDQRTPELSQLSKTGVALAAIALLPLPAIWREREQHFGSVRSLAYRHYVPEVPSQKHLLIASGGAAPMSR